MRRLHSLSGVVPLGAFLVLHLWTATQALLGRERFEDAVLESNARAFGTVFEFALVWLPLLFHAGYGVALTFRSQVNVQRYPYGKNWGYVMQRVSGLVAMCFVGFHLYQYRWQRWNGKLTEADFYGELCASLSSTHAGVPWMALAYLVGSAAVIFHFAYGLHGFCFSWGITTTRAGTRLSSAVFGSFGVVLFALAAAVVIFFATGSRLLLAVPETGALATTQTCRDLDSDPSETPAGEAASSPPAGAAVDTSGAAVPSEAPTSAPEGSQ